MRGYHDVGGRSDVGPIERTEHEHAPWEKRVDALVQILVNSGFMTLDEHRRAQETLGDQAYQSLSYYERWMAATTNVLLAKGVLDTEAITRKLEEVEQRQAAGDDRAL